MAGSEGLLRRRAGAQRRAGAAGEDIGSRRRSRESICRAGDSANSGREHGQLGGGVLGMTSVLMRLKAAGYQDLLQVLHAPMFPRLALARHPSREHCTCQKREAVESTVSVLDHLSRMFYWYL